MTIYTFETYFAAYHYQTRQLKTHKAISRDYWDKHNDKKLRKKAIDSIGMYKDKGLNSYEYLKLIFDVTQHIK